MSVVESALGTVADMFGLDAVEDNPQAPAVEPAQVPDAPDIDLEPAVDLPGDLDPDDDPDEFEDLPDDLTPDELRARAMAAEKKARYERQLRVNSSKRSWVQEAEKHLPYSRPEAIQADSKREFFRQAKERDQQFREMAAPLIKQFKDREAAQEARIRAEVEAEYAAGWGTPNVGGGTPASPRADAQEKLERARNRRNLKDVTTALIDSGSI